MKGEFNNNLTNLTKWNEELNFVDKIDLTTEEINMLNFDESIGKVTEKLNDLTTKCNSALGKKNNEIKFDKEKIEKDVKGMTDGGNKKHIQDLLNKIKIVPSIDIKNLDCLQENDKIFKLVDAFIKKDLVTIKNINITRYDNLKEIDEVFELKKIKEDILLNKIKQISFANADPIEKELRKLEIEIEEEKQKKLAKLKKEYSSEVLNINGYYNDYCFLSNKNEKVHIENTDIPVDKNGYLLFIEKHKNLKKEIKDHLLNNFLSVYKTVAENINQELNYLGLVKINFDNKIENLKNLENKDINYKSIEDAIIEIKGKKNEIIDKNKDKIDKKLEELVNIGGKRKDFDNKAENIINESKKCDELINEIEKEIEKVKNEKKNNINKKLKELISFVDYKGEFDNYINDINDKKENIILNINEYKKLIDEIDKIKRNLSLGIGVRLKKLDECCKNIGIITVLTEDYITYFNGKVSIDYLEKIMNEKMKEKLDKGAKYKGYEGLTIKYNNADKCIELILDDIVFAKSVPISEDYYNYNEVEYTLNIGSSKIKNIKFENIIKNLKAKPEDLREKPCLNKFVNDKKKDCHYLYIDLYKKDDSKFNNLYKKLGSYSYNITDNELVFDVKIGGKNYSLYLKSNFDPDISKCYCSDGYGKLTDRLGKYNDDYFKNNPGDLSFILDKNFKKPNTDVVKRLDDKITIKLKD